ncbi:transposable element Tcb2 transposase [Trichonephila clavipes]|nr:transposable element Tcb2 transposase [Trichonephila clavipes]
MQRDCALRIAGRGRLTSFSVEYKTGNQSLFECAESFTNQFAAPGRGPTCPPLAPALWSDRRVARQLSRSDWVVRRCWDQWIREMPFTRRLGSGSPRQISLREDHNIVRNALVQPTASSAAIQAQVAPSLGSPVSSRTIRKHLAEGHLGSRRPLCVLPLTPTHRRLRMEWCRTRGSWIAAVVFSDESRFNLSSDDNRVRVWRPRGERLKPAFALQRHTDHTAGVMVATHATAPGAIFQQDNARLHLARVSQDCLRTVSTPPWPARSPDLSLIEHIWDHLGWIFRTNDFPFLDPIPHLETNSRSHCARGSLVVKVSDRGWHVMSSSPVPLKSRRVEELCTLNLSRAQTSSRWCGS